MKSQDLNDIGVQCHGGIRMWLWTFLAGMSGHKCLQAQRGQEAETRVVSGPLAVPVDDKVTQDFNKVSGGDENCELKL